MAEQQFSFNAMDETMSMLLDRVLDCLDSTDIEKVMEQFASIKGPTIVTGSGGSRAAAAFIACVLNEKNEIVCVAKHPEEIRHMNLKEYRSIVAVSASGVNEGIRQAFKYANEKYPNVEQKSLTQSGEIGDSSKMLYATTLKKEDSFISFANTLMPMALALCYYIGDKEETKRVIKEMFEIVKSLNVQADEYNIYEMVSATPHSAAETFFESTLSESSIGVPVISGNYDSLHGRFTSILEQHKRRGRQMLVLKRPGQNDLDDFIHEILPEKGVKGNSIRDIDTYYGDMIYGDFYSTIYLMHWCCDLAKKRKIDLSAMIKKDENGFAKRIFLTASQKALEWWEKIHKRPFWGKGKPDFKGLKGPNDEKPDGFYGPTGKFLGNANFGPDGRHGSRKPHPGGRGK